LALRCGGFPIRSAIKSSEITKNTKKLLKDSEQKIKKTRSKFSKKWLRFNGKNCNFLSLFLESTQIRSNSTLRNLESNEKIRNKFTKKNGSKN
jgi:hypothetical protein